MKPRRPISYETNLPPQNYEPEKPGSLAARFAAMLTENLENEKHENENPHTVCPRNRYDGKPGESNRERPHKVNPISA